MRHVLNIEDINHRLCTAINIKKIQCTILESWNDGSGNDCGDRFTLVPFKVIKKINNDKHSNICVSHDFFLKSDDVLNKCTFTTSNTLLNNVVAAPLNKEEIEEMKTTELQNLEFNEDSPMTILTCFVKLMLPGKADEWLKKKFKNFIEAYCDLRELFQKNCKYRFAIVDGVHRINALTNVLYKIKTDDNHLSINAVNDDIFKTVGKNITYKTMWHVWHYKNLSKSLCFCYETMHDIIY